MLALLLSIFIGSLLHSVALSQIPLGSKLSVGDNDNWVSSNGDFAFGFFNQSNQPNRYSIGVRFNSKSIPEGKQTVVWVAGADITVSNESYFQLTESGELVLFDFLEGVPVWKNKPSQSSVFSASLFNNGNLVLLNENRDVLWQSFDTPSDTLLPGQNLTILKMLRAASNTSVSSYYTLFMNSTGELQLRWESDVIYWKSRSPSGSNLDVFLTSDGSLQLRDERSKPIWSVYGEDHGDNVNYRFLRLDVDGNLRLYSWVEALQSWRSVWQAVENQCRVFATCGQHGICVFDESGSSYCKCPFKLTMDQTNSRCLASDLQKGCKSGSNMFTYENMYLYGMYPPNDQVFHTSLKQCEGLCLKDPVCTASTYMNDGTGRCLIKRTEYVTGYFDPAQSSVSFVKRCSDPLAVDPNSNILTSSNSGYSAKGSYRICIPCLVGAASATFFVVVLIQMGVGFIIYRRRKSFQKEAIGPNSKGLIILSFSEIRDLTGDFKNQIGPNVYKGVLQNNQPVAIKVVRRSVEERKFRGTVLKIGSIHHRNIVKLEGYCCELTHRYLVYEFVKNGSIDKHMKDSKLCKRLTWRKRLDICTSVAKALCYLHTGCREFISHGNLKRENIVLDENLEAKVTEFGLASLHDEASAEKDVEDFGNVILEMISGCREEEEAEDGDFRQWIYDEWREGRAGNAVDRRIEGGYDMEEVERALRIGFWCIQRDERLRPSMGEIVKVLEGSLGVDPPLSPFVCQTLPIIEDESMELESDS